ncbi:hypothetical protein [Streptomyces buecherae]|uniref:hypothetical protein n=1 Tax=Streptomyces buecherae TaxID=2763006 RepID=UPI001C26C8AC|nr:hypothetical protein [Streptomyces buecherae]
MSPTARRAPDITQAREALHRALRLLEDQDDPRALDRAREAAQAAADAVPYTWRAPHCSAYRRNMKAPTCRQPACTRCAAFAAGEPMPPGDF